MLGDLLGGQAVSTLPGYTYPPAPGSGSTTGSGGLYGPTTSTSTSSSFPQGRIIVPSVRDFKIAENESPRPLDRFYFTANYYLDVDKAVNRAEGSLLQSIGVYRAMIGGEKTFLDGDASVGFRLPANYLDPYGGSSVASTFYTYPANYSHSHFGMGDLSAILKYAFLQNRDTGSLMSGGVAVTFPTGPATFADYPYVTNFHSTTVQPYLGYIWNAGRFYVHGFTSVDVPTDSRDVTILYNDIGAGYWLWVDGRPDVAVNGIVPTAELHINTPVNHRGGLNFSDPAGTPDVIDLTLGVNIEIFRQGTLGLAYIQPLSGPRPFDYEVMAQLNWRYGRSVR
jgi:hypothetical protein